MAKRKCIAKNCSWTQKNTDKHRFFACDISIISIIITARAALKTTPESPLINVSLPTRWVESEGRSKVNHEVHEEHEERVHEAFRRLKIPIFSTSVHPLHPRQRGTLIVPLREGDSGGGNTFEIPIHGRRDARFCVSTDIERIKSR